MKSSPHQRAMSLWLAFKTDKNYIFSPVNAHVWWIRWRSLCSKKCPMCAHPKVLPALWLHKVGCKVHKVACGTAFETLGSVQNEDLPLAIDEREKMVLKTATWFCLKSVKSVCQSILHPYLHIKILPPVIYICLQFLACYVVALVEYTLNH